VAGFDAAASRASAMGGQAGSDHALFTWVRPVILLHAAAELR